MKFSLDRDAALAAVTFARGAANRRAAIPILGSLRLTAETGSVRVAGNDLDMEAAASIDAEVQSAGDLALDAERLYGALSSLPSGAEVSFALDAKSGRVAIQCGRARFQIPAEKGAECPTFAAIDKPVMFEIASADLLRLLDATEFAVSRDQSRPYMAGVHFHAHDGRLRAVATDGTLLCLAEAGDDSPAIPQTVPLKAVSLLRDIAKAEDRVTISQGATLFAASAGRFAMATKVIDSDFPQYERAIPDPPDVCALPREPLARAIARGLAVNETRAPGVRIELAGEEAVISARGEQGEEAQDAFPVTVAAPFNGLFNGRRLYEIASRFEGESLTFRYTDPASPVIFTSDADPSRLTVLIGFRT